MARVAPTESKATSPSTTLCLLLSRGVVERRHLWIAALLVPAAFVGKAIGTRVSGRLPSEAFRGVSLGIVLLSGVVGVASGGWALLQTLP